MEFVFTEKSDAKRRAKRGGPIKPGERYVRVRAPDEDWHWVPLPAPPAPAPQAPQEKDAG